MKNVKRCFLASSLCLGMGIYPAQADQVCFTLSGFTDIFRLNREPNLATLTEIISGSDFAPNPNPHNPLGLYVVPLVGASANQNPPLDPGEIITALHGVNETKFFGNHSDCTYTFHLSGVSLGLTGVSCEGRVPGIFSKASIFAPIPVHPCGQGAPPPTGKALGQ